MKIITFFNNKGGVGKTTLVYHIAWMMAEMGKKVLAVDLDPQSNLSSMFLTNKRMEEIIEGGLSLTIYDAMKPMVDGVTNQPAVHVEQIQDNIGLIVGNLKLSLFEDDLTEAWNKCLDGRINGLNISKIFDTIIYNAAENFEPDIVLVDVGPNLGAINRAVLITTDYVIIPAAPDLFSLQGIRNLGDRFRSWREAWKKRKEAIMYQNDQRLPEGKIDVAGYIVLQHNAREDRPVKAYSRFAERIPAVYAKSILGAEHHADSTEADPYCLGFLKHYHSLLPMAMEAHKPIFLLKPADGAIGAHYQAVQRSYEDFQRLSKKVLSVCVAKIKT